MTVTVDIYIEDAADQIADYDTIRLYRGTDPSVYPFTGLPVTTATLVSTTLAYTLTDTNGTANSYYRYSLYNSSTTTESDQSEVINPAGLTLLRLRLEAARGAGVGFNGTCSETGTLTTLIDAALRDSGIDATFLEGAWIYRPDAAASGDRCRRVKASGFDATTGTLSFDRAYTNAPTSGEVYHVFLLQPPIDQTGAPYSWDRAVRDGLQRYWFVDQLNLGAGTSTRQTRFSLGTHASYVTRQRIRRVLLRTTDSNGIDTDVNADSNGRFWDYVENGPMTISLEIIPAPSTDQTVIVEVNRTDAQLFGDGDVTVADLEIARRAVVLAMYQEMNTLQPGKYAGEYQAALLDWNQHYEKPTGMVKGL